MRRAVIDPVLIHRVDWDGGATAADGGTDPLGLAVRDGSGAKHLPGGRRQAVLRRLSQSGLLLEQLLDGLIAEAWVGRQTAQKIDMRVEQLVIQFGRNQVLELRGNVGILLSEGEPRYSNQQDQASDHQYFPPK